MFISYLLSEILISDIDFGRWEAAIYDLIFVFLTFLVVIVCLVAIEK